ncbi:hypothetical protein [Ideonella paludis]|uniref:Uncharacterized protein n=1 Tax=Ideonella paludis TaxID=1233411 RepID=A0ABS5DU16_9BURK|nr:hypothetical protein [Ideonella paludis]
MALIIVAATAGAISNAQREKAPPDPAETARNAVIGANQNAAIRAAQLLKASMKDPSSFELKSLVVKDDGSSCYTIRAKNAFNASIESAAVLIPGKTPQLLLEERDSNRFVKAWNERCTKAGGEDITGLAARLISR